MLARVVAHQPGREARGAEGVHVGGKRELVERVAGQLAGEPAQRGGEVIAQVGKGWYVYTSYSWFRQLRAGVPGAYRQFANLVSLPKAPQRAQ